MEWTAFTHDRPERIHDVVTGERHFLHLSVMPAGEAPLAFTAEFGMICSQVILFVRIGGYVKEHFLREEVEAVMVSPHVEPIVPADRSLADVAALAESDLLAPDVLARGNGNCVGFSVPKRLFFSTQEFHERGG